MRMLHIKVEEEEVEWIKRSFYLQKAWYIVGV